MKNKLLQACFLGLVLSMSSGCISKGDSHVAAGKNSLNDFALGADISWITEMESNGHKFYNSEGDERECTALMKECGLNAVRLRVWVNPVKLNNWCNKEDFLVKAKRAKELNMDILVNFHYSDGWADPGHQNIPEAWIEHPYTELKKDVAAHTTEVLQLLKQHNIFPRWIQIGNETRKGFLWPVGHIDKNPDQYAGLFNEGYNAAKKVFPESIVMVHLDNGYDEEVYNRNLDILQKYGAKWDMVGMSLYPYWAMLAKQEESADETITDCIANIKRVSKKYHCDVMIVETGVECTDGKGNLADMQTLLEGKRQLLRVLKESYEQTDGHCKGVFYWEPECKPSKYRLGAFTNDGKPTVIMDAYQEMIRQVK